MIKVIYSGTRNLYPAMRGAVLSLLEHNPDANVYILAEADELPWRPPCEHEILNVSGQSWFLPNNPNMRSQFTYMAMVRACTADLIPDDRVLQLDVDTIVCGSLRDLWETDLEGKWLAWCEEVFGQWKPFGPKYYNFGVALHNLAQQRKDRAPELMRAALQARAYPYIDQDVMNLFAGEALSVALPAKWNDSFCCGYTRDPRIVHYAGYPNWYTENQAPRWWLREKYKKLADEFFGPETGGGGS